jgi:hypothetical protein
VALFAKAVSALKAAGHLVAIASYGDRETACGGSTTKVGGADTIEHALRTYGGSGVLEELDHIEAFLPAQQWLREWSKREGKPPGGAQCDGAERHERASGKNEHIRRLLAALKLPADSRRVVLLDDDVLNVQRARELGYLAHNVFGDDPGFLERLAAGDIDWLFQATST